MPPARNNMKWSDEEDTLLDQAVIAESSGASATPNWNSVAERLRELQFVRTPRACQAHYSELKRGFSKGVVERAWSPEESKIVIDRIKTQMLLEKLDPSTKMTWSKLFTECSEELGDRDHTRTATECETLWMNHKDSDDDETVTDIEADRPTKRSIQRKNPDAKSKTIIDASPSNGRSQISERGQQLKRAYDDGNFTPSRQEIGGNTTSKKPRNDFSNSSTNTPSLKTAKPALVPRKGFTFSQSGKPSAASPSIPSTHDSPRPSTPVNNPELKSLVIEGLEDTRKTLASMNLDFNTRAATIRDLNQRLQVLDTRQEKINREFKTELGRVKKKLQDRRDEKLRDVETEREMLIKELIGEQRELDRASTKLNDAKEDEEMFGLVYGHLQKRLPGDK